jgi:hypothetical protein
MDAKVREKPKDRPRFPLWIRTDAIGVGAVFYLFPEAWLRLSVFYFGKGPGLFQKEAVT